LSGVPIILKDTDRYLNVSDNKRSTNEALLSAYMDSHYPETILDEFWKRVVELINTNSYEFALDIGCSVGRNTFELARRSKLAIGIDLNFNALAAAEYIERTQTSTYKRRKRGRYYQTVELPYDAPSNAMFLVADALNPPFTANSFDVVAGLNILDNVSVPLILIGQMDALLKPDGDLIVASPYDWQTGSTDVDEWLENEILDAPEMLRKILEADFIPKMELKYKIQQEYFDVPWILRNHERHWCLYMVHLLKAKKTAGSKRPVRI
jgi:SAM-dependent methyltransferase